MKFHRLSKAVIVAALCLVWPAKFLTSADFPVELPPTDPATPLVLRTELGMNEKEVLEALELFKIDDFEKEKGTNPSLPQQFFYQSKSLAHALGGTVIFWFDDGKMLTRIYTNSRRLTIKSELGNVARVGDERAAFDGCLVKRPKVGLLPSKIEAAIYYVSGVNFTVIYPKDPGTVTAWAIEMREYSPPLTPIRD